MEQSLKTLFPNSLPGKENTEGYYNNPILILHDKISKKKDIKDFIQILKNLNPSDKDKLIKDLEKKMDDRANLFLRFDKQKAYQGELKLTEHGDSIHVKIKIAAYPAKKENAIKLAQNIWSE